VKIIRERFCVPAHPVNKIKGTPFRTEELTDAFEKILKGKKESE